MQKWCHPLVVSTLFRPNDIYQVYWDLVSDDKFKANANQDRAEVRVKAVSAWVASSETVQNWIKDKRIVQDRYYDEEDA